jgi:hypothetical protein
MLSGFTKLHKDFYKTKDLKAGGIKAMDRYGQEMFYQLLSLSVGAVRLLDFDTINSEADISDLASKAKSKAKKIQGNSLFQITPDVLLNETTELKEVV